MTRPKDPSDQSFRLLSFSKISRHRDNQSFGIDVFADRGIHSFKSRIGYILLMVRHVLKRSFVKERREQFLIQCTIIGAA